MAHYTTTVESGLQPAEAFEYMADFTNAPLWDPSVVSATRAADDPSAFDLVVRFGRSTIELRYATVEHEAGRLIVLAARGQGFHSRDTITVGPSGGGSAVRYDALLTFSGVRRLCEPVMQRIFSKVGDRARAGMQSALNP